jgi:hypothetical protein
MLTHRLRPFISPVLKKLGIAGEPTDRELLHRQIIEPVVAPSILPEAFERISASDGDSTLEEQLKWLTETEVIHQPVYRYRIKSGLACSNGYYGRSDYVRFNKLDVLSLFGGDLQHVDRASYVNTGVSTKFFGHWLWDACSTSFLNEDTPLFMTCPSPCYHCSDYISAFQLEPLTASMVLADELLVYQDFSQGPNKAERYRKMRTLLREQFSARRKSDYVYLRRGDSGVRRTIRNEAKLLDRLARDGWDIVDVTTMTVPEMQERLLDCQAVLGVEGSNMTHANFSVAAGGVMIFLTPHDRLTAVHLGICRANGTKVGFSIMNGSQAEGYEVDVDEVFETIDLTMKGG